jgi:autotransporter family porin
MEPFVIGSLRGNLYNDNQATLVSTGTTFHLEDNLQDVWGEVSGGVNFFKPHGLDVRVRQARRHLRR